MFSLKFVMGRNQVLSIYFNIKPLLLLILYTVDQFPIHVVVPKMTFSHLHSCSDLESSQSSPKVSLIPLILMSLSPAKPQSVPKSSAAPPGLPTLNSQQSDDLEAFWNPENV